MGWKNMGFKSYQEYLNSYLWKSKRDWIIECRENKCEKCGSKEKLNVHHLNYDNCGSEQGEDVIVLCKKCHEAIHKEVGENGRKHN